MLTLRVPHCRKSSVHHQTAENMKTNLPFCDLTTSHFVVESVKEVFIVNIHGGE